MGADLLCGLYRRARGTVRFVGLTDGTSDGHLLDVVDVPVFVRAHATAMLPRLSSASSVAAVAEVVGVEQWVEAIVAVVERSRQTDVVEFHDS
jgi:predicted mannosyl-3-phosphoglycerate phosphatase (HAD superfamily)